MGYIRSGPNAVVPEPANGDDDEKSKEKEQGAAPKRKTQGDEEEQVLWMGNERFAGNELLFHPSDIGELRYP